MNDHESEEQKDDWGSAIAFWGINIIGCAAILYGIELIGTGEAVIGLAIVGVVAYFLNEHWN